MSRIAELFKRKNSRVLNVYCTAGFPRLDSTVEIMKALQDGGADLIELGMPYSDPLANGMTIAELFRQLSMMRDRVITVPVLLMGYMNPVLQFGFEKFCAAAAAV